MTNFYLPASIFILAGILNLHTIAQNSGKNSDLVYDLIKIPKSDLTDFKKEPVIVAVVDDAFRLTHKELKDFIFKNPKEIPGNQLDDDGNNYTDDVSGWDISDHDNDVSILEGKEKVFFHGTYISSIITKVAFLHYGKEASKRIKIMPVKVLSDHAGMTYIKDGYKGIKYAADNGADIICLAWSGGNPGIEELKIIEEAEKKGILIISSAGNFNKEKVLFPAAIQQVFAVAGVNSEGQKDKISNYGMDIDISAPSESVKGAHPEKDNAYFLNSGTSSSAALLTGCAAIIMSKNETYSSSDVKEILLNSSTPFGSEISGYGGKLGSGIVNLKQALKYISETSDKTSFYSPFRPKGFIIFEKESKDNIWEIKPYGSFHGFYLEPDISDVKKPTKNTFDIIVNDTVWNSYDLSNYPSKIFVPSSFLKIIMKNKDLKKKDIFKIKYFGKTVDSTKLFCSGIRYYSLDKGTIDDGSGDYDYTNNCSCKWIIKVPAGKRIKFTFDNIDTQANIDFIHLFDGESAIPENYIAKFSGQNMPPVVYSRSNVVLVWFITDHSSTGKGWKLRYETID